MTFYGEPRLLLAGDSALVVEFGDEISLEVNRKVHALADALGKASLPGLGEAVPTYRSLLIHYDPLRLSCDEVKAFVSEVLQTCEEKLPLKPRVVEIPVVYGGESGPDIEFVAEHSGLFSVEEVIRLHSGAAYTVYMLGFAPGFAYLGGMPEAIATPRLETPRTLMPVCSPAMALDRQDASQAVRSGARPSHSAEGGGYSSLRAYLGRRGVGWLLRFWKEGC